MSIYICAALSGFNLIYFLVCFVDQAFIFIPELVVGELCSPESEGQSRFRGAGCIIAGVNGCLTQLLLSV